MGPPLTTSTFQLKLITNLIVTGMLCRKAINIIFIIIIIIIIMLLMLMMMMMMMKMMMMMMTMTVMMPCHCWCRLCCDGRDVHNVISVSGISLCTRPVFNGCICLAFLVICRCYCWLFTFFSCEKCNFPTEPIVWDFQKAFLETHSNISTTARLH